MEGLQNLGIDMWSILLYLVNFGILLAVLTKLLYRPVQDVLTKRQKTISDKISEADKIKSDFEAKLKEMQAEKEKAQAELKAELDRMTAFVSEKKKELTAEMDAEREKMLAKAQEEIASRKDKLVADAEKEILAVMQKIVLEIVQNKVPQNVVEESVDEAWKAYKK
jgi:F-type H+-transporting ATPase subunit b